MRRQAYQWLWLLVGISLFWAATLLQQNLKTLQVDQNLSFRDDAQVAPELSIALSMGVFRSIILDVLWMRASALQQEKRFYEIVQLYDLIGKLQPHNPRVWSYSAWNMAYNISVELPPGEERWRWVQNGLKRLIDHGLRYNPHDLELYKQTAWIYSHKIGRNLDDAHLYYKTRLYEQVYDITGPDFSAVQTAEHLISENPSVVASAANVQTQLKEKLGLELELMIKLEKDPFLGPLDWRLPQVQAIYWAKKGLANNRFGTKVIDLERLTYQAQQHILRQGKLVYIPASDKNAARLISWPDYRQALPMQNMFQRQIELFTQQGSTSSGVLSAYRAFLDEAIHILILAGQDDVAETLFQKANAFIPNFLPAIDAKTLMREQLSAQLSSMSGDEFSAMVSSFLLRHFWWKAMSDNQQSSALLQHAQQMWIVNTQKNKTAERSINRSFQDIKFSILKDIFDSRLFHPSVLEKLMASLPFDLKDRLREKK